MVGRHVVLNIRRFIESDANIGDHFTCESKALS